ncbi:hypothetical protein [Oceanihabitans sediminis]|uniref:hypothetical protein n=1 Tax=Oceanihabitans sediminis TaxID=1812012 RepID=UPI003A946A28
MPTINYIKHLNAVFQQFAKDSRLNPTHISLYMAFFQLWNLNRFPNQFHVNREDVMKLSKIGSKSTYHKCVKELDNYKYLIYYPSHNPFKGSKIKMLIFGTSSGQAVDLAVLNSGQALVPSYKHNKHIKNRSKRERPKSKIEVITFFKENKWPEIEAEKFFSYYESLDWKLKGETKIANWHATAQNWMLKAEELKTKTNKKAVSQKTDNLKTTKNKNYNQPL